MFIFMKYSFNFRNINSDKKKLYHIMTLVQLDMHMLIIYLSFK